MNRQTFASLSIGLTVTLFVLGSMPLAAADSPNVPLGITETPVPTETATNTPPAPTATPTPTPTRALAQAPVNTAVPATSAPTLTPTSTPTPTRNIVLPVSGAPSETIDDWFVGLPAILALIIGGVAALAMGWFHESTVTRERHERSTLGQGSERSTPPPQRTDSTLTTTNTAYTGVDTPGRNPGIVPSTEKTE